MTLQPNRPYETREPIITIDAGLAVGEYRIQLVVVNEAGQQSAPVVFVVTITRR